MITVEEMRDPGFFPRCKGIINSRQDISGLRVMVLGQDIDSEANHNVLANQKGQWKIIRRLET